ncbi:MAG: hybrid sensor histidine kinase/response regulator [Candidatus Kapaibacterium sp.]|nr:MAG: hybrid sensor histidine kinase/response regulator [Candidatus Kapabacteria bacterium]
MSVVSAESHKGFVLIVDDVDENLMIASAIIKKAGYKYSTAKSGPECIKLAMELKPDLILLDINMPGMNGIETCEFLKKEPLVEEIPVMFLTAVSDSGHIQRAFQVGGIDYIVKPFRAPELLARVNVHVELKRSQAKLRQQNENLEALNREKSEFLGIAAHDLKNPLSGITGLAELIVSRYEVNISEQEVTEMAEQIKHSAKFMFEIVANLLDVNRIEEGNISLQLEEYNIYKTCDILLARYEYAAASKSISLSLCLPDNESEYVVVADPTITVQILDNIVSNAIKYSPHGTAVSLSLQNIVEDAAPHESTTSLQETTDKKKVVRVSVQDEGPGFTEEDKKLLFTKFSKLTARPTGGEHSTGLGLSIAKKLIDLMGASIRLESTVGNGANFIIDFPSSFVKG